MSKSKIESFLIPPEKLNVDTGWPLKPLLLALRVLAVAFIAVAALHLLYGIQADALLNATIAPGMALEPSLDSQNRFYGITFSLLGVVC